ncbi:Uncharacterised protein [Sphingobacterium daejeonense]|nr:Uncharacterised protein [Sphingobacterium daejeonense]
MLNLVTTSTTKRHVVKQNDQEIIFKTLEINNLNLKQSI